MTKQEIKDLVAAKIAGQGSMVDVGGALADILNAIADAAFAAATGEPAHVFDSLESAQNLTEEQFLAATGGVTFEQLKAATHIKNSGSVLTRLSVSVSTIVFGYEFTNSLEIADAIEISIASDGLYNIRLESI